VASSPRISGRGQGERDRVVVEVFGEIQNPMNVMATAPGMRETTKGGRREIP